MIRFLRGALRNLTAIHGYYAREASPTRAHALIADLRAQIDRLAEHLAYGRAGRKLGTRELVVRRLPYVVIYRVEGNDVIIIRIQHTSRQPR